MFVKYFPIVSLVDHYVCDRMFWYTQVGWGITINR